MLHLSYAERRLISSWARPAPQHRRAPDLTHRERLPEPLLAHHAAIDTSLSAPVVER